MIRQSLGNYRLIKLLGRSGMGEVYLAEDLRLKRNVALKILPAEFATDQSRALKSFYSVRAKILTR